MTPIAPEIRQAGDNPIVLIDPATNAEYYLTKPILLPCNPSVASMSYLPDEFESDDWEDPPA